MKRLRVLAVLAAVLALAAAATACGTPQAATSPGPAASTSSFSVARYTSEEYGFAIDHPSGFTELSAPLEGADPKAPLFDILFADPGAAQIAGKTVDALEVAVYELSAAPAKADFATHAGDFEAMLTSLIGDLPDLRVAEPVKWTTVDGRPAVTETYTYTVSGHDVAASAELVFKKDRAYLVRAQAGRATWATTGHVLVSCMATFALL